VLPWVDRFGTGTIRARSAAAIDAALDAATEVVVHRPATHAASGGDSATVGDALVAMGTWSYGLTYAEALPGGDVGVLYYAAGPAGGTDIRWARLRLDE
jgi:hypothetical protein